MAAHDTEAADSSEAAVGVQLSQLLLLLLNSDRRPAVLAALRRLQHLVGLCFDLELLVRRLHVLVPVLVRVISLLRN